MGKEKCIASFGSQTLVIWPFRVALKKIFNRMKSRRQQDQDSPTWLTHNTP